MIAVINREQYQPILNESYKRKIAIAINNKKGKNAKLLRTTIFEILVNLINTPEKTGNALEEYRDFDPELKRSFAISIWGDKHMTPLHINSIKSKSEQKIQIAIAKLLLEHGAGINARDTENYTPLHIACQTNFASMVLLLLKEGAKPLLQTLNGKYPYELTTDENIHKLLKTHTPPMKLINVPAPLKPNAGHTPFKAPPGLMSLSSMRATTRRTNNLRSLLLRPPSRKPSRTASAPASRTRSRSMTRRGLHIRSANRP